MWYTFPMYELLELEPTVPEIRLSVDALYATFAYFYSPKFTFAGERHDAWELVYANSGEAVVETPDYEKIVSKGQVFLHTPGEPHKIRANNVSCNMFFISFASGCERLYEIAQKPIPVSPIHRNYILSVVEEGMARLAGKNSIPAKITAPEYAGGQVMKNLLELLLIDLIRWNDRETRHVRPMPAANPAEKSVVDRIIDYMKEHIREKIKLEQIATYVGYSVPRMCSLFREATGLSVIACFNRMRINKAKQLMAENDMSLRQISEYLDYDSLQYFSVQFKKTTGLPPSQYIAFLKSRNFQLDAADDPALF